ncbi:hypothetical protein [Sorangium sp. So ce1335]|uniref:hypothetical protein n=1 Tax=Sorangium sp. So ce1335 TaxID=3133335 RepID=UPI003F5FA9F6
MKKIARYALAFAVVTSVSGSAMALRNDCLYRVSTSTGLRTLPNGYWVAQLEEHVMVSPFDPKCSNHVNWYSEGGGPIAVAQSRMFYTPSFEWGDCYAASYQFTHGSIEADPHENNYAITANGQVSPMFSFYGMSDHNGVIAAMIKFSPLSSARRVKLTAECHGP